MSKYLFTNIKILMIWKKFAILVAFALVTACARPDITVPKSKYDSETLSKDWRANIFDMQQRTNTQQYNNNQQQYNKQYAYPQDNDADYVPPLRGYNYAPVQQQQYYNPNQQYQQYAPYPQDNDANYGTRYPTYDPDADNSGYYYINKDKKLPPPRKVDPYNAEQYDYPIYFD